MRVGSAFLLGWVVSSLSLFFKLAYGLDMSGLPEVPDANLFKGDVATEYNRFLRIHSTDTAFKDFFLSNVDLAEIGLDGSNADVFVVRNFLTSEKCDKIVSRLKDSDMDSDHRNLIETYGQQMTSSNTPFVARLPSDLKAEMEGIAENLNKFASRGFGHGEMKIKDSMLVGFYARKVDKDTWDGVLTQPDKRIFRPREYEEKTADMDGLSWKEFRGVSKDYEQAVVIRVLLNQPRTDYLGGGSYVLPLDSYNNQHDELRAFEEEEKRDTTRHRLLINKGDAVVVRADKYKLGMKNVQKGKAFFLNALFFPNNQRVKDMITTQRTTPHDLSRILNDGPTDKEVAAGKGEKPASQHYRHVCGRGEESVVPRTELEDAFQKTDTDGNGQLSKEELRSSLTKHFFEWLGREVPDKNLNRLYKSLGGDTQMGVRFEKTDKPARFLRTTRFESKLETGRQPTCFDIESPVAWMWRDAPTLHPRANLINNICPVLGKENGETDSCYDDAPQCRDLMESGLANCGDAWAMKMCRHTCRTCTLNCQKGHFDHVPMCRATVPKRDCYFSFTREKTHSECMRHCQKCRESMPETRCVRHDDMEPLISRGSSKLRKLFQDAVVANPELEPVLLASPGNPEGSNAYIVQFDDFLPDEVVDELRNPRICHGRWHNSTVASKGIVSRRTSSTCWCHESEKCEKNWAVQFLDDRVANLTGIPNVGDYSEKQWLEYGKGGHNYQHNDWNHLDRKAWGPRFLTVFIYLNDVPKKWGGATSFPILGKSVQPQKGRAVMWANTWSSQLVENKWTLHQADDLIEGKKFSANYWINLWDMTPFVKVCDAVNDPMSFWFNRYTEFKSFSNREGETHNEYMRRTLGAHNRIVEGYDE